MNAPEIKANATIRQAGQADLAVLDALAGAQKITKERDYFAQCLDLQAQGARLLLIASDDGRPAGYGILNWRPQYQPYRSLGIAEIQDLNVVPDFRRRGIATAVIAHCEALAKARGHDAIGISFGLHGGFGAAQRLYAALGYRPDGNGVTYARQPVRFGEMRPNDDDLCLMLLKSI